MKTNTDDDGENDSDEIWITCGYELATYLLDNPDEISKRLRVILQKKEEKSKRFDDKKVAFMINY